MGVCEVRERKPHFMKNSIRSCPIKGNNIEENYYKREKFSNLDYKTNYSKKQFIKCYSFDEHRKKERNYRSNKELVKDIDYNKYKEYKDKKNIKSNKDINCDDVSSSANNREILIGLENIGATCYMNATIQCLSNTKELSHYFLNKFKFDIYDTDKKISNEYHILLKNLWDENNIKNKPYSPYRFKYTISEENPLFKGVKANDSRDLINFLLERIHQELNEKKNNNSKNDMDDFNICKNPKLAVNKDIIFKIFFNNFEKNYNSIISNLFYGVNEIKTKCKKCQLVKYSYEIFFFLEFPLEQINLYFGKENNNRFNQFSQLNQNSKMKHPDIDIYECFEYLRKNDEMTGENNMYCNICQICYEAYYCSSLYSMPNYLILILNRGKGNIYQCDVKFPETLNLEKYVIQQKTGYMYDLYGVICHLGPSSMGGHFIAFCRHRFNNKWYKYNDSIVTECQNNEFLYGVPYILFYQRIIVA